MQIRIKILLLIKQTKAKRKKQNVFIFSQVPGELGGSGLDASGTPGQSAERSPGPPPVPALPAPPTPPDNPQNEEERRQVIFMPIFIGLNGKFYFMNRNPNISGVISRIKLQAATTLYHFAAKKKSTVRYRTLMYRNKFTVVKLFQFFRLKIAIYLSSGLHKERTSYRRSLQPSKENVQHFKT
jgi:hypothetical protein